MPTLAVDKEELFAHLGNKYDTEQFSELCFEFGIELEEDTSQEGELAPGERAQLKIDIPANRYDLLCFEGLSRALGIFLGIEETPKYRVVPVARPHRITVAKECAQIRPYVVGAILRGVTFTEERYKSFIDLQDKLHRNLCRKRTLVSIGTHDLQTVQGPFTYEARKPEDIKFVPLNQTEEMDGHRVIKFYESDMYIKKFLDIIRNSPVYPVIYDANHTVMSLPPLINSEHSKITMDTKDVFIEITATDMTKAVIVLNILLTMFSCYCKDPFTVEPVEVVYPDGKSAVYPEYEPRTVKTSSTYLNGIVGIKQTDSEIVGLLKRMSMEATVQGSEISVKLPLTRPDVLQECDIAEDLAIAFGYNNIPRVQNNAATVGKPLALNTLSDIVRHKMAMSGWIEALTLSLCSHKENFEFIRRNDKGDEAVVLENPKSAEYQVCRTSLLPGLLKTIRENMKHAMPYKIFEVSDVVFKAPSKERGTRNERHACGLFSGLSAQFEVTQGLLDAVMVAIAVPPSTESGRHYYLRESENPTYLPGRCASVMYTDKNGVTTAIGSIGVIHPEVLTNFELDYPVSAFEINIEHFV
ncbi:phenylalanine--tRNA ligase subunit beta [Coemansia sp. RSA 1813]|nr:phenylalanine--tRNA ligase subunit beta [Coemansia sp. RSA 1646]KAJ1769900.1 phenylalanine--tRNA ligase subunit beta [Coemansia sp. RSA 1843]KAJ2087238.1 phenylalanine--tRNA ligase subunit beta [Coemansia sp. RSA 986]KAJ2212099.1 phenylalanine--tRNA ligase subunit beta [Coemansia sp. RSA 487]KAJ2570963.1 phenylalanine--tRNA ligase subunit beta [Coemansia sp. RSA 1813]